MVLGFVFKVSGVDFGEAKVSEIVNGVVELVGALLAVYGRWRAGGVSILGKKK